MIIGAHFLFVHVMKTGGTWARKATSRLPRKWVKGASIHTPLSQVDAAIVRSRPVYAISRNPWDWHVSFYNHMHLKVTKRSEFVGDLTPIRERMRKLYSRPFCEVMRSDDKLLLTTHIERMTERQDGLHESIRWSKFEDGVPKAFLSMVENSEHRLSMGARRSIQSMGAINAHPHQHYREYYSPKLRELVAEQESKIIEKFNYVF